MTEIDVDTEASRTGFETEIGATGRTCPECNGRLVSDAEHGETVCDDCGLVVSENAIDRGPEWRSFDEGDSARRRVGAPTTQTIHDKGLSTTIDWQNRDASGRALSPRKRRRMERLRTWDERFRSRSEKDRNLKQALGEIDRMASALGLPRPVRETASVIYRRALDEDLLPGRSIEAVATGALYAAARQAGTPRSISEVGAVSRIDEDEFKRAYRYVARELELGVKPASPVDYVGRFASELDLSDAAERRTRELLDIGEKAGLVSGRSPVSLAAGAVYAAGLSTDEEVTQDEVAAVTDTSTVTIRNRYRELLDAANE